MLAVLLLITKQRLREFSLLKTKNNFYLYVCSGLFFDRDFRYKCNKKLQILFNWALK